MTANPTTAAGRALLVDFAFPLSASEIRERIVAIENEARFLRDHGGGLHVCKLAIAAMTKEQP